MSTDNYPTSFEERLLRAILDHYEEVVAQPGVLSGRVHRRLPAWLLATAASAIVVGGGVGLGIGLSGEAAAPRPDVKLDARLVMYRAVKALEGVSTDDIEYIHTTNILGTEPGSTFDQWSYATGSRIEEVGPDGSPTYDEWRATTHGKSTFGIVNYSSQSWCIANCSYPVPHYGELLATPETQVAQIKRWLGESEWVTDANVLVDGQPAIELTWKGGAPTMGLWPPECSYISCPGLLGSMSRLWVDPTTYLPIQFTADAEFQFEWLPPTAANLAQLKVVIPPGFSGPSGTSGPSGSSGPSGRSGSSGPSGTSAPSGASGTSRRHRLGGL